MLVTLATSRRWRSARPVRHAAAWARRATMTATFWLVIDYFEIAMSPDQRTRLLGYDNFLDPSLSGEL